MQLELSQIFTGQILYPQYVSIDADSNLTEHLRNSTDESFIELVSRIFPSNRNLQFLWKIQKSILQIPEIGYYSIYSQFGYVKENEQPKSTFGFTQMFGILLGCLGGGKLEYVFYEDDKLCIYWGYLSDKYGRRSAAAGSLLLGTLTVFASGIFPVLPSWHLCWSTFLLLHHVLGDSLVHRTISGCTSRFFMDLHHGTRSTED